MPICSEEEDVKFFFQSGHSDLKVFTDNRPLGRKMNTGMSEALRRYKDTDYVITTGSDDTINEAGMDMICEYMLLGKDAFGFTDIIFKKWGTTEYFSGRYDVVCGAFRTIKASVLLKSGNKAKFLCTETHIVSGEGYSAGNKYLFPKYNLPDNPYMTYIEDEYNLWPDEANQGLDTASGQEIEKAGFHIMPITGPFVTDHKSDNNIHSFESIKSFIEGTTY